MKIWTLMYDQSYESTIYKSNDYYEFFFLRTLEEILYKIMMKI